MRRQLPQVNAALASHLMKHHKPGKRSDNPDNNQSAEEEDDGEETDEEDEESQKKKQRRTTKAAAEEKAREAREIHSKNPLGDDRFSKLFTDDRFEIDESSFDYRMHFPNGRQLKAGYVLVVIRLGPPSTKPHALSEILMSVYSFSLHTHPPQVLPLRLQK